jgi:hypothetical protein
VSVDPRRLQLSLKPSFPEIGNKWVFMRGVVAYLRRWQDCLRLYDEFHYLLPDDFAIEVSAKQDFMDAALSWQKDTPAAFRIDASAQQSQPSQTNNADNSGVYGNQGGQTQDYLAKTEDFIHEAALRCIRTL